jgi:hypothetical protein
MRVAARRHPAEDIAEGEAREHHPEPVERQVEERALRW